jgi:putative membrane protein
MPPGPASEANRVAREVLRVRRSPTLAALVRHPRRALTRRLVRAVVPVLALALLLWLGELFGWLPNWPWQVALILLVPAVALGWDRFRNLGHGLTTHYLVTRLGSMDRRTVALQRTGIIGWRIRRSFFQRRAGLLTLTATTSAGRGGYHVLDLDESTGLALADQAVPGILEPFLEHR